MLGQAAAAPTAAAADVRPLVKSLTAGDKLFYDPTSINLFFFYYSGWKYSRKRSFVIGIPVVTLSVSSKSWWQSDLRGRHSKWVTSESHPTTSQQRWKSKMFTRQFPPWSHTVENLYKLPNPHYTAKRLLPCVCGLSFQLVPALSPSPRSPLGSPGFTHGSRIRWTYFGPALGPLPLRCGSDAAGGTTGEFPQGSWFSGGAVQWHIIPAVLQISVCSVYGHQLAEAAHCCCFCLEMSNFTFGTSLLFSKLHYAVSCLQLLPFFFFFFKTNWYLRQDCVVSYLKGTLLRPLPDFINLFRWSTSNNKQVFFRSKLLFWAVQAFKCFSHSAWRACFVSLPSIHGCTLEHLPPLWLTSCSLLLLPSGEDSC